jgi:xylulokinase
MFGKKLLIDVGGTFIKSAVVEGSGNIEDVRIAPTPSFISTSSTNREIDPRLLVESVKNLANLSIKSHLGIDQVYLSGQMGSYVICDEENQPLTNIVTWQDRRNLDYFDDSQSTFWDEFRRKLFFAFSSQSGFDIKPGSPVCSLFRESLLSRFAFTEKQRFHSLISFVSASLASKPEYLMHSTDAASSGLYNVAEKNWNYSGLDTMGIQVGLPEVTDEIVSIGWSDELSAEVLIGVGDQQASLLGVGINEKNCVVNIGTGGQVARLAIENLATDEGIQVRPYFGGLMILTKTHLPAGRALEYFVRESIGSIGPEAYEQFMDLASIPLEGNHKLNIVEYWEFRREQNKLWDGRTLARAFQAEFLKIYLDHIDLLDPRHLLDIVIGGGVGQKYYPLSRALKGKSGRNTLVSSSEETTLEGLAMLTR